LPHRVAFVMFLLSESDGFIRQKYNRELGISYWTKNYRTVVEENDPDALNHVRVLRSRLHIAGTRAALLARTNEELDVAV
jgi:hypothetical protein